MSNTIKLRLNVRNNLIKITDAVKRHCQISDESYVRQTLIKNEWTIEFLHNPIYPEKGKKESITTIRHNRFLSLIALNNCTIICELQKNKNLKVKGFKL